MHDNNSFTYQELKNTINLLGIKKNDSIFLSTDIGSVGFPKTNNKNFLLTTSRWLYNALKQKIGKKGNIFVPTYSYTFAKKRKIFDLNKTRAEIGYFPNFFLKQPNVIRSIDPMVSISGYGPEVKKVFKNLPHNSYGKDCLFARFLELRNLKCLHFGLGYNWIPFIHYLDWINKVPFRFEKYFNGKIIQNKKKKLLKWKYFARDLREETISNGYRIGKKAKIKKIYKSIKFGRSIIHVAEYKQFFNFAKKLTKNNLWLTAEGPKYIK